MSTLKAFTARALGLTALLLITACSSGQSPERAAVEFKGTDPAASGGGQSTGRASQGGGSANIVRYEGYQAAVARDGDTVASVAERVGVSASELGAYNGLPTDHELRAGDELVLPARPEGYGGGRTADTGAQLAEAPSSTGQDTGGRDTGGSQGIESAPLETAPPAGTSGTSGGWSAAVAEQAIERAGSSADRSVAAPPPSAGEPLPPDPQQPDDLASPQLGQYQTPAGESPQGETAEGESDARVPAPRPVETITTPAEQPPQRPTEEATAQTTEQAAPETATEPEPEVAAAPAASGELNLIRPARGPIVVGFQQGSGRMRNDGVDFASPVGSPVVAAADGEVALVSQSLGGLGNIVLVRHPGDYLTVYGRIDQVAVQKGDVVSQGQQIGTVASNATPRMHFEVRKGAESLNPERFFARAS